jgi:hypothetical protein
MQVKFITEQYIDYHLFKEGEVFLAVPLNGRYDYKVTLNGYDYIIPSHYVKEIENEVDTENSWYKYMSTQDTKEIARVIKYAEENRDFNFAVDIIEKRIKEGRVVFKEFIDLLLGL